MSLLNADTIVLDEYHWLHCKITSKGSEVQPFANGGHFEIKSVT